MLKIICILSVVAICILMFFVNRQVKVGLLFLNLMLFSLVSVPFVPFGSNSTLLVSICMIVSEYKRLGRYFRLIIKSPIGKLLLFILIGGLLCCIFSPHLHTVSEIKVFFNTEYMIKYFALAYSFSLVRRPTDLKPALNIIFYGLIVLTFFAAINVVTGSSFFLKEVMSGAEVTNTMTSDTIEGDFHTADRFRAQATFMFPFDYGFICCISLALVTFGFTTGLMEKNKFLIALFCCLFGVFSCGCRTILFCALVGAICYLWIVSKSRQKFYKILGLSAASLLLLLCIPFVRDKFSSMTTMFSTESDVEGSSLLMRITQYSTVLDYVDGEQILVGNGYNFFNIDLGWADNEKDFMDKELEGLEGVVMNLVLERGIVGVLFHMLFYGALFVLVIREKNCSKSLTALGVTTLLIYILFANMTGELSSVYPTLIVVGYVLKSNLFLKRQKCTRKSISQ